MTIEELKARKTELGYTNKMLSEISGVPLSTVQKIFSGITKAPRYETLSALEAVLNISFHAYPEYWGVREEPSSGYNANNKNGYTLDDYYALPEEKRAELIDGVFYDMSAPSSVHQLLVMEIAGALSNYIRSKKGSCIPIISPIDVQLDCDDRTLVQPDIIVVCDRSRILRRCIYGAPDLIIEVLSQSTRKKDMYLKLPKYKYAGVREYWIVDPDKKQIIVYYFDNDDLLSIYNFDDAVPVGILGEDCTINFAEICNYIGSVIDMA